MVAPKNSAVRFAASELASLMLTAFVSYRVIDRLVGGRALVTVTSLLTLYVVPQLSQYEIAKVMSLVPDL